MPGLNAILKLVDAVGEVERNLTDGVYVRKAVGEKKEDIIKMNVSQLYEQGVNSLGIDISSYQPYSPYTIRVKKEKGQPIDRVTLRDTGAFHGSFTIVTGPDSFYITATDPKTEELISKYGGEIFGLTDENRSELTASLLYPVVIEQISRTIFS